MRTKNGLSEIRSTHQTLVLQNFSDLIFWSYLQKRAKAINLLTYNIRPAGLVVWFLLRVQEVPGSIPGRAHVFYIQLDSKFSILFLLSSNLTSNEEPWLQTNVVNDRSVIKQNLDMETWALSSTADDDGKFQPICKYLLDQNRVKSNRSYRSWSPWVLLSRIYITKQTLNPQIRYHKFN